MRRKGAFAAPAKINPGKLLAPTSYAPVLPFHRRLVTTLV
jgi:hypothetical protein